MQICQFLFEQVGQAPAGGIRAASPTPRFRFERSETRMDFAGVGRRDDPAVVGRFILQAMNRGGEMFVVIPQAALAPLRQALSRVAAKDTAPRRPGLGPQDQRRGAGDGSGDPRVLETSDLTLGDIASLKVGQVIKLHATTHSRDQGGKQRPAAVLGLSSARTSGFHTLCIDEVDRSGA